MKTGPQKLIIPASLALIIMISGSGGLAISPSTTRLFAERYNSNMNFHEAKVFGHYLMLKPDWKKIAEFSLIGSWRMKPR